MEKWKQRPGLLFFLLAALLLSVCFLTPVPTLLAPEGAVFSDGFSNNLMMADARLGAAKGIEDPFARYLDPVEDYNPFYKNAAELDGVLRHDFAAVENETFHIYTSNLTVHRYLYIVACKLLPPALALNLLQWGSAALLALALAGVLVWLRGQWGTATAAVVGLLLGLFSPILAGFATNLYWAPYTWFLPLLGMVWALRRSGKPRFRLVLFLAAFATCFIKMLFYFEFVSCVMVAMMLPVFANLLQTGKLHQPKSWLPTLLAPVAGALAAFAVALGVHLVALAASGLAGDKGTNPVGLVLDKVLSRTHDAATEAEFAQQGYATGLPAILREQLRAQVLGVRGLSLSLLAVAALLVLASVAAVLLRKALIDKPQLIVTALAWVSLAGPLSWLVLAKLHVVDHMVIDLAVWYLPFLPLCYAALVRFAALCVRKLLPKRDVPERGH